MVQDHMYQIDKWVEGEAGGSRKRKYAASLIKLLKITTEY